MAIDSKDKRNSAGSLLGCELLPDPDGGISTADRLHCAGFYRGIVAQALSLTPWFYRFLCICRRIE